MRCIACNKALSDFESTRKDITTGEFVDMCNECFRYVQDSVVTNEREDLRHNEDIDE